MVYLVPAKPEKSVREVRRARSNEALFAALAALGRHERFALAGIAGRTQQGGRSIVYVHAKVMLVDDVWATIRSCNLHVSSLFGNAEMNASFWDPGTVRAFRRELFAEHLGQDTGVLDDREALAAFRQIAQENRVRRKAGDLAWQGLAFALDPAACGE